MTGSPRLRRLAPVGLIAVLALALAACGREYPNTTFSPHSDLGRSIDFLWQRLWYLGAAVFVLVEGALLYVVFRYRRRSEDIVPPQTHGNVTLEITWTLIPAAILAFIAVPTVRTIFETQAPAPANSLVIEVYGHQWWWEFKYPEYNITTANEVYIPKGRTVDFVLQTRDVLHSFWVPQLAGKRDLIANHINHIWFTPDRGMQTMVWNGFCTEYCGASHAEMHFRVVTVDPAQFAGWVSHQQAPAAFLTAAAPANPAGARAANTPPGSLAPAGQSGANPAAPAANTNGVVSAPPVQVASLVNTAPAHPNAPDYVFPRASVPDYAIPHTPLPNISYNDALRGDPASGEKLFTGAGTCNGCHTVAGNPLAVGNVGPNLTHVGTRIGIAGVMYVNDAAHLARWIKNARVMKAGSLMPTLGKGEYDPQLKTTTATGLSDQQIADLVAYLQALK